MFDLDNHRREYCHQLYTIVDGVLPDDFASMLLRRANDVIGRGGVKLVNHAGRGTQAELDAGGAYYHYIFTGSDITEHLPELRGLYHGLLPTIAAITLQDAIISPHPESDINIKAYPAGGGTLGRHLDTNGITVLIYLTTNIEGALVLELESSHPSESASRKETKRILAKAGSMIVMQGRKVWHRSEPMDNEQKVAVAFNYYQRGDTWRPAHFDAFVYKGIKEDTRPGLPA
jgi:hypothetical protein